MIKEITQILSQHKWAVFFAILVGLIMILPEVYFRYEHQDIYQGIGMHLGGADEMFYLLRVQEIRDGHFETANPYWAEGKDLPYLRPPLAEMIVSSLGWIFNFNMADTVLLGHFVFPFLIFLLIYTLVYQLTRKKSASLAASTTVLLATNLMDPKVIWDFFINQKIYYYLLPFNRVIAPQVHALFFFGFLLFFWLFLKSGKSIYVFISGLILGFSFYTYPYTWTFIYAFLGLLVLIYIWQKKWSEIKNIVYITGISLLVALPYFWNLWQAMHHPLYLELAFRSGLVKTHLPQIGSLVLILSAIFLLFFSRQWKKRYYFCLALVLAPWVVLNQQIITGQIIIPEHYHWYFHKPLAAIFIIIIIFQLNKKFWPILTGLICSVGFCYALITQVSLYKIKEATTIENQRYGDVFQWLNNHSQKDEVVATHSFLSDLILVYTHLNSAAALDAHYYLAADEQQLWQRMFLERRLDGLKGEEAREKFLEDKVKISGDIYGEYFRKGWGGRENTPDEKIYSIAQAYQESLSFPLEEVLEKFQVKYLVWDALKGPDWQIDQYPFFKQVYQSNGVKIYQLQ